MAMFNTIYSIFGLVNDSSILFGMKIPCLSFPISHNMRRLVMVMFLERPLLKIEVKSVMTWNAITFFPYLHRAPEITWEFGEHKYYSYASETQAKPLLMW